jgi:hypothetical protein
MLNSCFTSLFASKDTVFFILIDIVFSYSSEINININTNNITRIINSAALNTRPTTACIACEVVLNTIFCGFFDTNNRAKKGGDIFDKFLACGILRSVQKIGTKIPSLRNIKSFQKFGPKFLNIKSFQKLAQNSLILRASRNLAQNSLILRAKTDFQKLAQNSDLRFGPKFLNIKS